MGQKTVKSKQQAYKDKTQLRKEVERRCGYPLEENQWLMLEPDYGGPYSEEDVREILKGLPKRSTILVQDMSQPLVPKWLDRWFEPFGQSLRECFGLSKPIELRELGLVMDKFRVDIGEESEYMSIDYPVAVDLSGGACMCEVASIFVTNKLQWLVTAKNHIDNMASLFHCPPALLLAHFLCEPKPYRNKVTVVLDDWQIKIGVDDPGASPKLVAKAYSLARKQMVNRRNRRRISERKKKLYEFIGENLDIGWEGRLTKWNSSYPQWEYENVASMQVVYSRAKGEPSNELLWSVYGWLRRTPPRVFRQKELWDMTQKVIKQIKEVKEDETGNH